jgi:hypothetical protein
MTAQIATSKAPTPVTGRIFSGGGRPAAMPESASDRRRKELAAARAALLGGRSHAASALRIAVTRAVRDARDTVDAFRVVDVPGTAPARAVADAQTNAVDTSEVWTWSTQEH